MKKLFVLFLLLQLSVFAVKAQNCGTFATTDVCSQAPPGQQTNCCRCIGTQPQNASFCAGTPINKGLIALIIGGLAIGLFATRKQFNLGQNAGI